VTDDIDPMEEPLDEQSREALQRTQAKLIKQIEDALDNGGKKTIRYRCKACGNPDSVEVEMVDVEGTVRALATVSAALAREKASDKGTDATAAATKLLVDLRDLSDVELAERIARLKAEVEAERGE
jgi:hypothetical protein